MPAVLAETDVELARFYEDAADEYQASLTLEDEMESYEQGTQRAITLSAFEQIATVRPDIQCFNEILIQYPRGKRKRPGQVCPDNFVVVHDQPITVRSSFNTPLQPVGVFLVIEYVSPNTKRKDYVDNLAHYRDRLGIPYYLLFDPDHLRLTLYRMADGEHVEATPNRARRLPIPEIELEVAVHDGWVRYWFRGELVPLTGELAIRFKQTTAQLSQTTAELRQTTAQLSQKSDQLTATEAEIARLKAELAKLASGS